METIYYKLLEILQNPKVLANITSQFFFGTYSSIIINSIIFALFAFGCIFILWGWIRTSLESKALSITRQVFQEATQGREHELFDRLNKASIPETRLVVRSVSIVQDVKKLKGDEGTITDALRTVYLQRSTWPRYISSILIILGLMGTIIGLSHAIVSLKGVLLSMGSSMTSVAFERVIDEIIGSLTFMETAFSTTLCGFVFYLILSFIDHLYQKVLERFEENFDSFISNLLIPFFTPEKGIDEFAELARIMKVSTHSFNETAGHLEDLISLFTGNQEMYGQMADNLHGTVESLQLSQEEIASYYVKITEMVENFLNIAHALEDERKENRQVLEGLFYKLGGDRSEIEKLYRNLENCMRDLERSFEKGIVESSGNIKVAVDLQNQEIKRLEADHDSILKMTTQKLIEMSRTSHEMFAEMVDKTENIVVRLTTGSNDIIRNEATEALKTMERQRAAYDNEFRQMVTSVSQASLAIQGFQDRFADRVEEGFEKIAKDLPTHERAIAEKFINGIENFFNKMDKNIDGLILRIDQTSSISNNLNTSIRNLTKSNKMFVKLMEEGYKLEGDSPIETVLTGKNILKMEYLFIVKKLRTVARFLGMRD